MTPVPVESCRPGELSGADRRRCETLSAAVWPRHTQRSNRPEFASAPPPQEHWPEPQRPRVFLVRRDGVIVAKARMLPRRIATETGSLVVGALAGVLCDPDHRGRGYGTAVVRAAFGRIDDGAFDCAFFQTAVPGFYEKLGARRVHNRLVNSRATHPHARPFWEDFAMVYPADFPWPDGTIDTLGPGW